MTPPTPHRPLGQDEIRQLEQQGCTASDWHLVEIKAATDLRQIAHVHFSGVVRIGLLQKSFTLPGGLARQAGIRHATLHSVDVGDDCLVEHAACIANYDLGAGCVVWHTDLLATTCRTTFGLGTRVAVLSETGQREIVIHDRLSAQEAYMQAFYRHNPRFVEHLQAMAQQAADEQASERGTVGERTAILYCGRICNVRVGEAARLEGVTRLENGTVCSHPAAPTVVGDNVIARDFIVQTGCHVADGAMLTRCYVGQASVVGHGFTASDTFFGCNCQAENGEACAVLAGPFTVTHHKSTLLIGGMFSFMNAGSATNQSNHAYKLGPVHYGVLERGCKTGSGTHISWPVRIGAFSLVMGHCDPHVDSHAFPFSYVVERGHANCVLPGLALRSVGTLRDIRKWPQRDGRADGVRRHDRVVFDAFSPYTMDRIVRADGLLAHFEQVVGEGETDAPWSGCLVPRRHWASGRELYRLATDRFVGEQLLGRLEQLANVRPQALWTALQPQADFCECWCDVGGLLAPKSEIKRLEDDVAEGRIGSLDELDMRLDDLHSHYADFAWAWTWHLLMETYPGTTADNFVEMVCVPAIERWETAAVELNRRILADAGKEFAPPSLVEFGIDGDTQETVADALAVVGRAADHPLVQELEQEQAAVHERAAVWLGKWRGGRPMP